MGGGARGFSQDRKTQKALDSVCKSRCHKKIYWCYVGLIYTVVLWWQMHVPYVARTEVSDMHVLIFLFSFSRYFFLFLKTGTAPNIYLLSTSNTLSWKSTRKILHWTGVMNLYFYCSSTRFKDSPEIKLARSAIKITIWFNIHEQYMLICTKSGNYFTKASLFKSSRSVKCISVVAMSCMCSHIAAANTHTNRRILKKCTCLPCLCILFRYGGSRRIQEDWSHCCG